MKHSSPKPNKIAPEGTFLHDYMVYMQDTETSAHYDLWCGLWLLSLAVGRSTIVDRPRAPVYLNLFVILAANSGVTRKSSAVRAATAIARDLVGLLGNDAPLLVEGKVSPEQLEYLMHQQTVEKDHAHVAISVSELITFLGREKYTLAMPGLLTDLYDSPSVRNAGGTVTRGPVHMRNVYVSFLSASTPNWLVRAVNPDVVEGGFTSRCVFIVDEKRKKRIAWPLGSRSYGSLSMADALRSIRQRAQPAIALTPDALRFFSKWYNSREEHIDPFRASFESREDAHVLRVAALLSVNDDTWQIGVGHLKRAVELVAWAKMAGTRLFEGTGSTSNTIIGIEKLRDALLSAGKDLSPRSKLFLRCRTYLDQARFQAALDIMLELGMLQKFEGRHAGAGRPSELYRGTELLTARGMIDSVITKLED